ncbi:tetratricopeptide repeat protein [Acaryochloris sp. IP29b_bin.148]|uniref:tetratricopeptide repeat protein n=1 Tax=Acaryochloris sp. IP29b_bin.148 TaxID=2969218 RepID=UPI00262FE69A|nr:tetratricopeptide repeat protein [Acaryochloris sp. IP29b_bin.148]
MAKIYQDNLINADALINRANKRATNGDLEGALDDFNEAIAQNPAKATAYFNRGFLYNALGKFEAAIHDFAEAIARLPEYDEAYFQRGNSYRQLGEFRRAIQDYSQAIRINPYCIKAYYKRADSRSKLGDYPGALTDYSQVILRVPKDANAYCQRGIFLSQSGELEKAIEDFSTAIEQNPRLADAYFHRGYCLAQLGEAEKASEDFSEALLHDPNHQAAYTRAYTLGMLKAAPPPPLQSTPVLPSASLSKDMSEDSISISAQPIEVELADVEDDWAEAHSETVSLEPTSVDGLFERANNRSQRGDLEGAIADYSKIIDHDPQNSRAYFQRSQRLEALGESQAAMADLNQATYWARVHSLSLIRDFSGELSTTLDTLKQDLDHLSYASPTEVDQTPPASSPNRNHTTDQAKRSTLDIPSERPASQPSIRSNANLNSESESKPTGLNRSNSEAVPPSQAASVSQTLDRAIAEYTRAIERNPLNIEAFFKRGQSRALAGDLQGAIADYSHTIRLDPHNGEAYLKRARCLSALGDEAAAQADLNHAIRCKPINVPHRPHPSSNKTPAQPAQQPPVQPNHSAAARLPLASTAQNEPLQPSPDPNRCTHEGNSPGNQFCIHCGEPLNTLSRYDRDESTPAMNDFRPPQVRPADSNHQQRLQTAESHYDEGVALFQQGDRQGSLQALSAGLKIFLEQREMQRYQQTLNLMQDVAHALNDIEVEDGEVDENPLL